MYGAAADCLISNENSFYQNAELFPEKRPYIFGAGVAQSV
jgi:hypothetical protein